MSMQRKNDNVCEKGGVIKKWREKVVFHLKKKSQLKEKNLTSACFLQRDGRAQANSSRVQMDSVSQVHTGVIE